MTQPRPADWEQIVSHLLEDTDAALTGEPRTPNAVAVPIKGSIDYLSAALARFREVIVPGGYDVSEVTLSLDFVKERVNLLVSLELEPSLFNPPR